MEDLEYLVPFILLLSFTQYAPDSLTVIVSLVPPLKAKSIILSRTNNNLVCQGRSETTASTSDAVLKFSEHKEFEM